MWGKVTRNPNFVGVYFYSMDSKNRLAIPSKFRFSFPNPKELVLSRGLEGCLTLYLLEGWLKLNEKLESMSLKNRTEQRAFKRMLYASACEVELDDEGRILIPQHLAVYGQLRREVSIIGLGEKIEIWAKHHWQNYQKKQSTAFTRHAAQLEI